MSNTNPITDEEQIEVQKEWDIMEKETSGYVYPPEIATRIQRSTIARGLFNFASTQIMLTSSKTEREERRNRINKAVNAIGKAYTAYPMPIFLYDLASFMELGGDEATAKKMYKDFLDAQLKFMPTEFDLLFLRDRDIKRAVQDATIKIGL